MADKISKHQHSEWYSTRKFI